MAPKYLCAAFAVCSALLAGSLGGALADEYRAGEFLGLDLAKAVLSPKPLGPPAQFAPVPVEARADPVHADPRNKGASARVGGPKIRAVQVRPDKPRGAAPGTRLTRRHGNPLDAQAQDLRGRDTRIQVWPCRSGGICDWQRQ